MKKILGILGGTVFALALFFNSYQTLNANAYEMDLPSERCQTYCEKSAQWDCRLTYPSGEVVRCLNAMPKGSSGL